jgi:hypothetical protein
MPMATGTAMRKGRGKPSHSTVRDSNGKANAPATRSAGKPAYPLRPCRLNVQQA